MSTKHKIASAAGIIVLAALLSKILGFLLNVIIAAKFGVTYKTDAFVVAMTIPDLLRDVLAGGAFTSAFIPVFISYLAKNQLKEANKLATDVINLLFIGLMAMALIGIIFAPILVKIVAPGFEKERFDLTVKISRILFPAIVCFGLASIFGSILNSYQHFIIPAFNPLVLNLSVITAILLWAGKFDIFSLAFGVMVGGFWQFAWQIPAMIKKGIKYSLTLDFNQPGLKQIGFLLLPLMFGLSINHLNIIVNKILASTLAEGNVAALNFANLLNQFSVSVFGLAISTAVFPLLSWQQALEEKEQFRKITSTSMRMAFFISIPVSVGFMFFKTPLVRILFERGVFDSKATRLTSGILFYYAMGTFALVVNYVTIRAFYALNDTSTPVKIGASCVALNIILNIILIRYLAQNGLALGSSLAALVQLALLTFFLNKKIGDIGIRDMAKSCLKIAAISILAVGGGFLIWQYLFNFFGIGNFLNQGLLLGMGTIMAVLLYILFSHLFNLDEGRFVTEMVKEKFFTYKRNER